MPDDPQLGVMKTIRDCVLDMQVKLTGLLTEIKRGNDLAEYKRNLDQKKDENKKIRGRVYQGGKDEKGRGKKK